MNQGWIKRIANYVAARATNRHAVFSHILTAGVVIACGMGSISTASAQTKLPIEGLVSMGSVVFNHQAQGTLPDNTMEEITTHVGVYQGAVINVLWSQLEPSQGTYDFSAINTALATISAYNTANPTAPVVRAKLRVNAGAGTPSWIFGLTCGTGLLCGPIAVQRDTGMINIGAYWAPAYKTQWRALQAQLAASYDGNPAIAEVAVTSCSSDTDEPFIVPTDTTSQTNLRAFVYTDTKEQNCLTQAESTDYTAWVYTPLDFPFNPLRLTDSTWRSGTYTSNATFSTTLMNTFRTDYGTRAIVSNHDLVDPILTPLVPIYNELTSLYNAGQAQMPPVTSYEELQGYSPTINWSDAINYVALPYYATEVEVWLTTDAGNGGLAPVHCADLQTWANALPGGGSLVCTGP
jgi:hypothetical protein